MEEDDASWNSLTASINVLLHFVQFISIGKKDRPFAKLSMSQSKLFLHDHPASSYAQKVRMALREKGIPFDMAIPDSLGSGRRISGLEEANPRMEVPALVDGDFKIFDSKIILQYLEDQYPEHPLLPKDPKSRAEARMIEEV